MSSKNVSNSVIHFSKMSRDAEKRKLQLISEYGKNPTLKAKIEKYGTDVIFKDEEYNTPIQQQFDTNFYVKTLLGLSKPYGYKNSKNKYICNYDEREWRLIIHDGINKKTNWEWNFNKDEFDSNRECLNKRIEKCKDGFLTIPEGFQYYAITHIIVNTDKEIRSMIQLIMKSKLLFGENISYEERLILVSKVTSFERIEKDY